MTKQEQQFVAAVWDYYTAHGRHQLPWRKTRNPYRILVSEIMLQQTQVDRVLPKYQAFLKLFPTVSALASAPLRDVLVAWQGLGYNRRARALHAAARVVMEQYRGRFPRSFDALLGLPGVGPYTAGAIMAFAYNQPIPVIETNIRSVYLHHFFAQQSDVSDAHILERVSRTLDHTNPREWYYALMDYGVHIKKTVGNPNTRARTYTKQSTFRGSDRQIRGAIIALLATKPDGVTAQALVRQLPQHASDRIREQLDALMRDELVAYMKRRYMLPTLNQ